MKNDSSSFIGRKKEGRNRFFGVGRFYNRINTRPPRE
jgi:hypothetical protein